MEEATPPILHKKQSSGETFCGADRGTYKWCQTISDLDVTIPVPGKIASGSNVRAESSPEVIRVGIKSSKESDWNYVIDGKLSHKTKPAEFVWSLEPGKHVTVHLEKVQERWWNSLLENEPKINLEECELSRPVCDLSEEEEMTLQKLWSKQLEKRNGPEKSLVRP